MFEDADFISLYTRKQAIKDDFSYLYCQVYPDYFAINNNF